MSPRRKTTNPMKRARKRVKLTQTQVAKKVGISTTHYARIERGDSPPSIQVLQKIAKVLKIKATTIFPD